MRRHLKVHPLQLYALLAGGVSIATVLVAKLSAQNGIDISASLPYTKQLLEVNGLLGLALILSTPWPRVTRVAIIIVSCLALALVVVGYLPVFNDLSRTIYGLTAMPALNFVNLTIGLSGLIILVQKSHPAKNVTV